MDYDYEAIAREMEAIFAIQLSPIDAEPPINLAASRLRAHFAPKAESAKVEGYTRAAICIPDESEEVMTGLFASGIEPAHFAQAEPGQDARGPSVQTFMDAEGQYLLAGHAKAAKAYILHLEAQLASSPAAAALRDAAKEMADAVALLPASDGRILGLLPILCRLRAALASRPARETCDWKYDGREDDYWTTSCGLDWCLEAGMPKENGYKFCPHCGKPINFIEPEHAPGEDDKEEAKHD
jgi:hypothetical protein